MYCQFAFQSLFLPSFFLNLNSIKMTSFFPSSSFLQEGPFQANKQASKTYIYARKKSCYKKPQRDSPWKVLLYCNVSMDWASKALYLYPYLFLFLILLCCNADQRQFKVSFFIFGSFQIIYVIILCAKYSHED